MTVLTVPLGAKLAHSLSQTGLKRAFALFLKRDFDLALADLDRALERSPMHIAALSGKGLTLIGMGREDEGRAILREALELNPWLPERHLLTDMAKPKGKDL